MTTERAERAYYRLTFPENLEHKATLAFIATIGALPRTSLLSGRQAVTFEVWGDRAGIHHRIGVPGDKTHIIDQLRTATGGLHVDPDEGLPLADFSIATEHGLTSNIVPMDIAEPEQVAAAILTSLQPLADDEVVVIQWIMAPSGKRPPRPKQTYAPQWGQASYSRKDGIFGAGVKTIFNVGADIANGINAQIKASADAREAVRQEQIKKKWQGLMFEGICRIGVRSRQGNAALLHSRLMHALQSASGNVRFKEQSYGTRERVNQWLQQNSVPVLNWPVLVNSHELSALLAFPIGSPAVHGLHLGGSFQSPPPPNIPANGRVLAYSNYGGVERPLAIPWPETLRHFYTVGSSGSGKTTMLENCALQDMERGVGLVYIDPKGDSAERLINCIPRGREQDVIYFNPADKKAVVGLNLFAGSTHNPSLATDNIVGLFSKLYEGNSWGPRLEATLRAAVRTLANMPGVTMLEVPELLSDERFRAAILQRQEKVMSPPLRDFWRNFNASSDAKRAEILAPVMNKLQAFTLRDEVRHVIGQSVGIDIQEAIAGRKIIIANLGKGELGQNTASLLGSVLMMLLWQAVQRRPIPSRKMPFYGYVDECQDFLNLPTPLGDMLAQARGYGFGLTLANQHFGQLNTELQRDVLANSNSFAFFRLPAKDANLVAPQYGRYLSADDFMNLGQYEIITSISTGSHDRPRPTVGTTYSSIEETGSVEQVLQTTRAEYSYPCAKVDQDIEDRRAAYMKRPNVGSRPL